jgi:hypothetical protein
LKPFIRIGTHYVNMNHIIYAISGPNGLRIVTTGQREDGKSHSLMVKAADADAVKKALEPFVAFSVEVETKPD